MSIKRENILRDTLANYDETSGASDDYCKGMVVGVVSTLMATGMTWEDSMRLVGTTLQSGTPRKLSDKNMPHMWRIMLPELLHQ